MVTYVPSEDSCADGLTKALAGSQFKKMCQGLCVVDREGVLMNGVFCDHHTHKPGKPLRAVDERKF
jgi:hypothetical protein